jgi:toxin ParE1/3/4
MNYAVILTAHAVLDIEEICDYITTNDLPQKAEYALTQLENSFDSLSEFPERGSYPKELSYLGIREYREIYFKPYRIIYRIIEKTVYIYLVADGRRDMEALLQRRVFDTVLG